MLIILSQNFHLVKYSPHNYVYFFQEPYIFSVIYNANHLQKAQFVQFYTKLKAIIFFI